MVTLGGGLQAVESLPGGVPTYSLCISLPIFLYFSSHFGDGINLAKKRFVSYLYDKTMTLFLKLIFLHIKLYLIVLYNTYQIFIFIHVVLHWWFLSEDNRMIVVGLARRQKRPLGTIRRTDQPLLKLRDLFYFWPGHGNVSKTRWKKINQQI